MAAFGEYVDDGTASTVKSRDYKDATDLVAFSCKDYGNGASDDLSPTLRAMPHDQSKPNGGGQIAIAFQPRIARNGRGQPSEVVPALNGSDAGATSDMRSVVAIPIQEVSKRTGTSTNDVRCGIGIGSAGDPMFTLQSGAQHGIGTGMAVRRLTPRECERLQRFPDDWTRYADSEQLSEFSDSVRYKMLGNAVNVACSRWIGQRIVRFASGVLA